MGLQHHLFCLHATTLVEPPPSNLYNTVHESIAKELLKQHTDFEEQPKHCQVQLQTSMEGSEVPTGAALCMQEELHLEERPRNWMFPNKYNSIGI